MVDKDEDAQGVSLTTENPDNVPLYQHFGYRIVGTSNVGPGLTTWGFYREGRGHEGVGR
jgi:hypothetical protein